MTQDGRRTTDSTDDTDEDEKELREEEMKRNSYVPVSTLLGVCSLVGCVGATRSSHVGVREETNIKRNACIDSRLAYSPAASSVPRPFELDLSSRAPFSSRGISKDDDTVGAVVQWWIRPIDATDLPRWALVINRGTADGIFCLVSQEGVVEAALDDVGTVQAAYVVRAAPTSCPQILLFSNPGHGTGFEGGEFLLLEWRDGRLRRLANGPRYADILLDSDRRILTLPIICVTDSDWFLILPSVDAEAARGGSAQASGVWDISFRGCECVLLRWDPVARRYRDGGSAGVQILYPDLNEAWTMRQ
jgi:hypothetical protein